MKAQSVRRTLTYANVLLVLAMAGAGAWYWFRVKPSVADDGKRVAWVKPAMEAYVADARNATPTPTYPVREDDFKWIVRPDLTDVKKGAVGVWPFVGPTPPAPKPPTPVVEKPPEPVGLEALGRLHSVILADSPVMIFVFSASNKRRSFGVGDRIEDKEVKGEVPPKPAGAPREPGLYLLSIERVPPASDNRFKIAYEVVSADANQPPRREEAVLATKGEEKPGPTVIRPVDAGPSPGGPVAQRPAVDDGVPPPRDQVKLVLARPSESTYQVEFDDTAYRYFKYSNPDRLIEDVGTEDAKDASGQPKGVRISNIAPNSVANEFGVLPGDIIKSINDRPVHSRAEAIDVAKSMPKDTTLVKVVIERNGVDRVWTVDPRDPKVRAAAGKARYGK